ncbi:MAG TPA: PQQ-dependent sugar dehydrogenase [Candidatus Polarisedimenticolia bacterium]
MKLSFCLGLSLASLCSLGPVIAGIPPAGFQETTVISGINLVTGFDWAPGGDLWIISKDGLVRVLHPGAPPPVLAATIPVNTVDERGLLGIALDPDFTVNGFLYLYYTVDGAAIHNRVSRFRVAGDTLVDETILLEGPTLSKVFHNSGNLRFGLDGLLYISMGDNAQPLMAQERNILLGKILRIAPDGSIPPTNPFVGDPNSRPEVWAYGLRNPWRFSIQPGTGNLFIGDVGDSTWEELDLGVAGANYGYPLVEGPAPAGVAGMTYPIYFYNHNGGGASITGGDHMVAGNFPSQYEGNYFFGDYVLEKIYRMTLDSNNLPVTTELFVNSADSPVHIRTGPDGALYYASIGLGAIYRVAYVGGVNQQPVAQIAAIPDNGLAPLTVQFDLTGSFDPDGGTLTYLLYFGDESTPSTSPTPSHTYTGIGVFHPTVVVNDGSATATTSMRVVVGNRAPSAAILSPAGGSSYDAGDVISFSGTASDPEDGPLSAGSFSWSVLFHHNTHTHPWVGPIQGVTGGTFATADSGETATDVWYEVRMTATDSGSPLGSAGALPDTRSVGIYPNLSSFTLATSPRPDLGLTLEGAPVTAPQAEPSVVGLERDIGALSPQTPGDGHTYTFSSWSDGGSRLHTITTPASPATWTATFTCNLIAEASNLLVSPGTGGTITLSWTAPTDPCLTSGPVVYHVYASASAVPSAPPGSFPLDPSFGLVASTTMTSANFTPGAGSQYYLVVGIGSDGAEGAVGAYGR